MKLPVFGLKRRHVTFRRDVNAYRPPGARPVDYNPGETKAFREGGEVGLPPRNSSMASSAPYSDVLKESGTGFAATRRAP